MRLALIPARGQSRRIPRKNIRPFHGKPIINYSIEAALSSGCFDQIVVSTDDDEIADISRAAGADVPFMRPANLSDDYATTMDVIAHGLNWFEVNATAPETICCIYATAPFLRDQDLQASWQLFSKKRAQYCFAATEFPFPVQRGFTLGETGEVKMLNPEHITTRSQDLPTVYHDAGQFYWCRPDAIHKSLPIFAKHSVPYLMERKRVQDIDTMEDWDFAELLYKAI